MLPRPFAIGLGSWPDAYVQRGGVPDAPADGQDVEPGRSLERDVANATLARERIGAKIEFNLPGAFASAPYVSGHMIFPEGFLFVSVRVTCC